MASARHPGKITRICRGSACTCQLLEFCNVINSRQPCTAFVNFLSITQLFLLCIPAFRSAVTLRASSVRFVVPQCFAALQQFERIVEARLGLLGLYSRAELVATEISPVKRLVWPGCETKWRLDEMIRKQRGLSLH